MVLLFGALLASASLAQHAGFGSLIYPEKLRTDAELLRQAIHQAHPDPYRYLTRGELDSAFDQLIDELREPLTADRFLSRLMPVVARVGDSNLRLELDPSLWARILREANMLPFTVRVIEQRLYVGDELKGFRSFVPGARIVSINGINADRVIRDLGQWVATDGANETWRRYQVQERFALLFLLTYGSSKVFVVETEGSDGIRREDVVAGLMQEDIERSRKPNGVMLHPWRSTWDAEAGTLWIDLTTLDPEALKRSGQKPKAFLDALLAQARDNKAKALVLDLRGADGKELGMAEWVFAAIAKEPFRLVQDITVRATQPHALPGAVSVPEEFTASVDRSYLPSQNGSASLRPDDPRLAMVTPSRHAFTGKVYVVCDGGTRDAAAMLAMVAHRSGRARLVGEEPATNAHSFTGGRSAVVMAPNSGLRLEIPLLRYIPEGVSSAASDHGEQPKHTVAQSPAALVSGRDEVRSVLLRLLRELH